MIQLTEHLSTQNIEALSQLAKSCKKSDGNKIAFYPDLLANERPKPSSILLVNHDKLIGFASAFFFEIDCAEISLLIHPKYRKRQLAKKCLRQLLESIAYYRPVSLLSFSVPHDAWKQALQQQGFTYQNTEYEMKYAGNQDHQVDLGTLSVRQATFDDMAALCELDQRCFPSTSPHSELRFNTLLRREQHAIFVLLQAGRIIGKAHVNWDLKTAFLSDIAILPEMQNQGFGTKIISYCIDFAHKIPQNNIRLSVETHNKHALKLYLHLGFKIINAMDYWQCSFKGLCDQLEQFKWFPDNDKI